MAMTPRRPVNPKDAAEALFKPVKKPAAPVVERRAAPEVRELVTLKLDSAVLEHFQKDGPGWQDRINDTLRKVVEAESGA
ncbi:MAG: BrnA antitoxin family protein [Rhizobium sp.]|nr:BrnA antitoxin family protein [Rhizobium sp.]